MITKIIAAHFFIIFQNNINLVPFYRIYMFLNFRNTYMFHLGLFLLKHGIKSKFSSL